MYPGVRGIFVCNKIISHYLINKNKEVSIDPEKREATQEDLDANPALVEAGVSVGDQVEVAQDGTVSKPAEEANATEGGDAGESQE